VKHKVFIYLLLLIAPIGGWALQAPKFDSLTIGITDSNGIPISLPSYIVLKPFMAYEAGTNKTTSTKYEGSVRVDIETYLAAVVLGEIGTGENLDTLPNWGYRGRSFYSSILVVSGNKVSSNAR